MTKSKIFSFIKLFLFYTLLTRLPSPTFPILGPFFEWIRYINCKGIFKKCGKKVSIGVGAHFGKGFEIEIGDYSGIGKNCKVPNNIYLGNYVMMGPNVTIYGANHNYENTEIPMLMQGVAVAKKTIIEDDVWIGGHTIILPGRTISKGTIIGAGSVVTKDFPPYSIIGGNPAKLIRSRI